MYGLRRLAVSLDAGRVMLYSKLNNRCLEIVERVESLIHAGEPQEGHLVEIAERSENCEPDIVGFDLGCSRRSDDLFNLLSEDREIGIGHGSTLASLSDASDNLFPTERFSHATAFDHAQAGRFCCAEAPAALRALPTPTNCEAIVARAGIDDARIRVTTEGAEHGGKRLPDCAGAVGEACGDRLAMGRKIFSQ